MVECTWRARDGGGLNTWFLGQAFLHSEGVGRGHLGGEDRLGGGVGQEDFVQEADARLVRKPSPESSSQVVLGFCLCRTVPTPPTA